MRKKSLYILGAAIMIIVAVAMFFPVKGIADTFWTITEIPTLGGAQSIGFAMNDSGQVIGSSWVAGDTSSHTFLYSRGKVTDLYPFNSQKLQTIDMGINNAGQIASGSIVNGVYAPAVYDSKTGNIIPLGTLGGVTPDGFGGSATSINNVAKLSATPITSIALAKSTLSCIATGQ